VDYVDLYVFSSEWGFASHCYITSRIS
jgi:hypothetical protein